MEAAMGGRGALLNNDAEWESICGMLSIDQDDNEGLLSLLMGDIDDPIITSPFAQFYTQRPLPNLNTFSPNHLSSNKREREPDQISLPKKKARVSKNVGKGKRKTQPRKNKLKEAIVEEDRKSSCDASENDESNVVDSNGKKRASRGSATDPQSLYARRRRDRINERLKILQTLVPNGTKVDISTMLEEAVNYVKFLQLQIKLLSSDDMWMYAPLAYKGFDVGNYNSLW